MTTSYCFSLMKGLKKENLLSAIFEGGKKYGFKADLISTIPNKISHNDILFLWNRHMNQDIIAKEFEKVGAKVIILENPYLQIKNHVSVGISYPNNRNYAIPCKDSGERFKAFNMPIKEWNKTGKHILIPTQAKQFDGIGLGFSNNKQPQGWDSKIIKELQTLTKKPIMFRKHPNSKRRIQKDYNRILKNIEVSQLDKSINNDLKNAWATVVYTSNAATESLLNGVPVFLTGPTSFLKECCNLKLKDINSPNYPDNRPEVFKHMAWNQYSLDEIRSGFLFDILLKM